VSFEYAHATSLPDALAALAVEGTVPVAGGTDLVPCVDEGILAPTRVLDVRALPGARDITLHPDGSATLGAAVRISDLATHSGLRERFPVLAEAAASVGTPALRNMGTLGGNLAQRHHCWYFRRGVGCFKRGGTQCAAVDGEHEYHGIVADGTCRAVHPSDPAVALEVLDATVVVASAGAGERRVSIAELFAGAAANPLSELTLAHGELITAIELPAAAAYGTQHWEKVMQRGAWDFALVSCAAVRRTDGAVRLALGGVALAPWRISLSVEEDIASGGLDEDSIDALAERAMYDVEPLARNGYKVTLAQTVLRRAMQALG
jgi:xanthine dehydrogenase YagS FAD-binding subunit